jgi:hypothetical protein
MGAASASTAGLSSPMDRFVAAVQRQLPEVAVDRREEEVAELGDRACHSLASGHRVPAVADEISGYGLTGADARALVTLARDTAC